MPSPSTLVSAVTHAGVFSPKLRASIILVNYNGGESVLRCLETVLSSLPGEVEVLVIDNASTDSSAAEISRWFPEVRLICNEVNSGFGGGGNLGAKLAHGEYLAFLNPDTLPEPGWLEALLEALAVEPQAGLATSKLLLLDLPERINTCGNDIHMTGLTQCRGMYMDREVLNQREPVDAVSGAAFAIRRDLFNALGGFDEDFFLYMEDTDLSLRARLAGYSCFFAPESIIHHDYRLRFGPQKIFYQERNRYLMLLKTLHGLTLLVLIPALLLAEIVTWGFVLAYDRGRLDNKLRAYAWILKHWKEILAKRRQVQALRRTPDRVLLVSAKTRLAFEQTGKGLVGQLAHLVFDPCFYFLRGAALALIWW